MRRLSVLVLALGLPVVAAWAPHEESAAPPQVMVYKDPNCGCCKLWIDHLRRHGFQVTAKDTNDVAAIKRVARVPRELHSCHTAFVNGYTVEGHVPATDIQKLITLKPKIAGIAVGGMPVGSPGMEMGNRVDQYDVIEFTRDGTTRVFAKH